MKDNKFFGAAFIAVLVILLLFVSTQIPTAHSSLRDLPVALVVEDEGEMGTTLVTMIQSNVEAMGIETFEFIMLENQAALNDQFAEGAIYGGIVVPSDFSSKYASLQSASPTAPTLQILVNQGKNSTIATMVNQAITTMVTQMNANMSNQLFGAIPQNDVSLSVEQAKVFSNPIRSEVTMVNPTGKLANAPLSFFQPIWMGSLVSAILLWLAGRNRIFTSFGEQIKFRLTQFVTSIVLGLLIGYLLTWFTTWILNYEYVSFNEVALFASVASIGFIVLILAVTSWLGIAGVPVFVLLMFFGLPLLQLTPEMMPSFYTNWIYPWLPMRFLFDGMKEILFFGGEVWNSSTVIFIWIIIIAAILLVFKGGSKKQTIHQKA